MAYSPARAIDVGSVIASTYTIEGLIGKGGMGAVYLASHARLPGKKVAIKVLHPDIADAEALARFRREAEIASRLGHPNIVEVHDWNQLEDGTPYLVLELLHGEALNDRLRRGPLPLDEVYAITRQVGSALAAAHREGIVHRDLKPHNIFLLPVEDHGSGVGFRAKVLDFGISKIRGSTTVKTQEASLLGTPQYMAPEQATGQHSAIDGRTDVFALGAVVYEMIAGVPAFRGETIPEVVFKVVYEQAPPLETLAPETPAHVVHAVARALAKKPDERWPDIASFVEALTRSPLTTARRAVGGPVSGQGPAAPTGLDATAAGPPVADSGRHSASGSGRQSAEAYAATVGSGDHGKALADSARQALVGGGPVADSARQGMVSGPAGTVQQPPPAGSRRWLWVALAAVAVAGGAMAVVVAVGGGGSSGDGGGSGTGTVASGTSAGTAGGTSAGTGAGTAATAGVGATLDAATGDVAVAAALDADVPVTAALDAGVQVAVALDAGTAPRPAVDAAVRVARVVDAGAVAVTRPGNDDDDGPGPEPEVAAAVASAEAALRGGDPQGAIRIAKKALLNHPNAQALRIVKARAECSLGDREAATATLQRVRKPRVVRAILSRCSGE